MRFRTPAVLLPLLLVTLSGCADRPDPTSPGRPNAIVNGVPAGDLYPNVGALMFDYYRDGLSGDDEWCTGTLITPTIFLTAAHCVVSSYTPAGSQFYVSFASDLYAKGAKYIKATGYVYDPAYGHDQADLHDLALVFLPDNSTRGLTPARLPKAGILDALSAKGELNGSIWVNVGYGTSANRTGVPSFGYDGKRNMSESEFMALQPSWLGLNMNTAATGLGGDCYGDSGGPKFRRGDATTIYATVTTGDYNCRATTWDYRLDTPEARAFLGNYVRLP
jgi:hypothetical protein